MILHIYRTLGIVALFAFAVACTQAAQDWQSNFPFVHDPIPFQHKYETVRVEEKPWSFLNVLKDVRYLVKMKKMMTHSSQEVEDYFDARNDVGPWGLDLSAHYDFQASQKVWSLGAVGDIMHIRKGTEDYLRQPLTEKLAQVDFLFGNLESPIVPGEKPGMLHKLGLRFNTAPELLDTLANGGKQGAYVDSNVPLFDILSIVNNHSFDRGVDGLKTTMFEIGARGMHCVGIAKDFNARQDRGRYEIVSRNGLRVGYVAYTWGINAGILDGETPSYVNEIPFGVRDSIPDMSQFTRLLRLCRQEGADLVIASVHWGYEFEYYPEPHFMKLARLLAANGADMVVGHGPHVVQPIEVLHVNIPEYENTNHYVRDEQDDSPRTCLVAYSLGNFTTVMNSLPCRIGGLLTVEVAQGNNLQTGEKRCLLTKAQLSLYFAQHKKRLGKARVVTLRDVSWSMSDANKDSRLKNEVKEALSLIESKRLGQKWLTNDYQWLEKASNIVDLKINRYECPSEQKVAIVGKIHSIEGDRAQIKLFSFENLQNNEIPLSTIRHLNENSDSLAVVTNSDFKVGEKFKATMSIRTRAKNNFECTLHDM